MISAVPSIHKRSNSSKISGQGIAVAPKAYFAKQSMERKRNCEKPGFCRRQKWHKNSNKGN